MVYSWSYGKLLLYAQLYAPGLILAGKSIPGRVVAREVVADVAVIGGGASGAYAASRLQDRGFTVALVEQQTRLGGHSQTFTDATTNAAIEYGVVFFHDNEVTRRFMHRYDIEPYRNSITDPAHRIEFYDLQTGTHADFHPPELDAVQSALAKYDRVLTENYFYLDQGYSLPDPVPGDLLLPFLDFAKKHHLGDMLNIAFQMGQGYGNFLDVPTLYAMKIISHGLLQQVAEGSLLRMRNNSDLYARIQDDLGSREGSLFLGSHITHMDRTADADGFITLPIEDGHGARTRIKARQGLLSIPPVAENLSKFMDLDGLETSLFSQIKCNYYWAGVLRNARLPKYEVQNVDLHNPGGVPTLPGMYVFEATEIPNVHTFWYGADTTTGDQTDDEIRHHVLTTIRLLRDAEDEDVDEIEFLAIENFSPFACMVNSTAIRDGFYRQLYELQGRRNTWWTGAAWHTHDSSKLWEFTEELLEDISRQLRDVQNAAVDAKQDL